MSFDLELQTKCDHRIIRERHFLDLRDRKTVRFSRPASTVQNIEVYVDDRRIFQNDRLLSFTFPIDELRVDNAVKLLFDKPLRQIDAAIEMSFTTTAQNCRRCHGIQIEDDPKLDTLGKFLTIENSLKALQDSSKWVRTVQRSNIFHEYIGTRIETLIGTKNFNFQFLRAQLAREVFQTLSNLIDLQKQQSDIQVTTPEELIERVDDVIVDVALDDPTIILIFYTLITQAGDEIRNELLFNTPGIEDFLGREFQDARADPRPDILRS